MNDKKTDSGFVEKISSEYYNLTAAEKRVADYILSHRTQCQHMSISDLAEASNVAEATTNSGWIWQRQRLSILQK